MTLKAVSIHVVDKKEDSQFVKPVEGRTGVWQTAHWTVGQKTRNELIGGTVFVHQGQLLPSYMGGEILEIIKSEGADANRYTIYFKRSKSAENFFSEKAGWGNEKKIDWQYVPSEKVRVRSEDEESEYPEGAKKFKIHSARERDPKIAKKAKLLCLEKTRKLACEVCTFDFAEKYGQLGEGFIEAHHKIPVAKLDGKVKTKISDLAMVCSNCHRMLHRGKTLRTIESLRSELLGET